MRLTFSLHNDNAFSELREFKTTVKVDEFNNNNNRCIIDSFNANWHKL